MRVWLVLAVVLAACSLPPPPDDSSVTAPLGHAPGRCGEVTEFAYVGDSTLRLLGFDDSTGAFGDDFNRPGRFWVTLVPVNVEPSFDAGAAAARRREERGLPPMPVRPPERPGLRMLCVAWADGDPRGLVEMAIPADWSPPSD